MGLHKKERLALVCFGFQLVLPLKALQIKRKALWFLVAAYWPMANTTGVRLSGSVPSCFQSFTLRLAMRALSSVSPLARASRVPACRLPSSACHRAGLR